MRVWRKEGRAERVRARASARREQGSEKERAQRRVECGEAKEKINEKKAEKVEREAVGQGRKARR